MDRRYALTLFAGLAMFPMGCSSHSIRDGIWSLTFRGRDELTQEAIEIPSRDVRVLVDWSDEVPEAETIEIERIGSDEPLEYSRMYGTIEPGGEILRVRAQDRFWIFKLYGEVKSPELVNGTAFLARSRRHEEMTISGEWLLRFLREE